MGSIGAAAATPLNDWFTGPTDGMKMPWPRAASVSNNDSNRAARRDKQIDKLGARVIRFILERNKRRCEAVGRNPSTDRF
jgi:hypothetical protein